MGEPKGEPTGARLGNFQLHREIRNEGDIVTALTREMCTYVQEYLSSNAKYYIGRGR